MKIWTEHPAKNDVEAVLRGYFSLLQAAKIPEAEQLIDHMPVRHVVKALWNGSVGTSADADESSCELSDDQWEQNLPWLRELEFGKFVWGLTDSHVSIHIAYHAKIIEVSLAFWIKPTDAGWVISGPATLW
ncbi:hypothetical protein [Stackebrandtia soli]|uniref:hypothetical protein n=1 Tax=Stackebrandtia soli TaxID=1892856 RepID=UPI0039ED77E4